MAYMTAMSTDVKRRNKQVLVTCVTICGALGMWTGIPILILWMATAAYKLLVQGSWDLLCLLGVTVLLPYSGGIGSPVYALFSVALAVFVTSMGWNSAEGMLRKVPAWCGAAAVAGLVVLAVGVRVGLAVPVVSAAAKPLLIERERTFQLEEALAWLKESEYCGDGVDFAERSGNPVDSIENALNRRYRPPSDIKDVKVFWNAVLRCDSQGAERGAKNVVTITFGGQQVADSQKIFEIQGLNAGPVTAWVGKAREADRVFGRAPNEAAGQLVRGDVQ
jgi:hypothetical protein